jgi:UDP:flavonoid glycosyltransferase YjiC (YdhE family)
VLLVSLGSAYTNEPEIYRRCFEAFGDLDWHVVLSVGKHVHPAALGGTMEGLYHGVPMVGLPMLGEQAMNAARLVDLGVGRHFERDQVTAADLRSAVLELADDPEVARRLAALKAEVRAAGGTTAAADVIEAELE